MYIFAIMELLDSCASTMPQKTTGLAFATQLEQGPISKLVFGTCCEDKRQRISSLCVLVLRETAVGNIALMLLLQIVLPDSVWLQTHEAQRSSTDTCHVATYVCGRRVVF